MALLFGGLLDAFCDHFAAFNRSSLHEVVQVCVWRFFRLRPRVLEQTIVFGAVLAAFTSFFAILLNIADDSSLSMATIGLVSATAAFDPPSLAELKRLRGQILRILVQLLVKVH